MDLILKFYVFLSSVFLSFVPSREFREGVSQQPNSFFPMQTQNSIDKTVSKLIFRGLFKYNIYGELENDLVDNYEISSDGLSYTFKLKDNQYWIDGKKITADDILYTAYNYQSLQGTSTDKIDDLTVKFTLQNKYSPFLSLMTQGIVQNNSLENQNPLQPVTSGEFRIVKVRYSGPIVKEVMLYSSKYKISKITYMFYSNDDDLSIAAQLGEIDAFVSDSPHDLPNFTNYKFPIISNSYGLFFNLAHDLNYDLDFRKNVAKVIDYDTLSSNYGIPVEGVISKDPIFTNKKYFDNLYDPKFKNQYQNKSITVKAVNSRRNQEILNQISRYLGDSLNVNLNIELFPKEQFISEVIKNKDYDVLFFGIETQKDPDRYTNWHSSGIANGYNFTNFKNTVADKSLESGRIDTDLTKRISDYNKFQEVFSQNIPAIFLFHPYTNYYISNRVSGIGTKYTFDTTDRYLDFANWLIN